jgi:hypothetical protein
VSGESGLKLSLKSLSSGDSTINSINLTVKEITLFSIEGVKTTVPVNNSIFNILETANGQPFVLSSTFLPIGRYREMRLVLGANNTIVVNSVSFPLKTPSAQQSGLKIKGFFEISESSLLALSLAFDPRKSIHWTNGQGYLLKPVIQIVSSSLLPGGPYTVTGLVGGTPTVANLNPTGTIHFQTSLDPRFEIRGHFFYNSLTKILHVEPDDIACTACGAASVLPAATMSELAPFDLLVDTWNENVISGTAMQGGSQPFPVSLQRTDSFSLPPIPSTSVNIIATYPGNTYNGKIGILVLTPDQGNRIFSLCNIADRSASFALKIPNSELGPNLGDMRTYTASLFVTNDVNALHLSAVDKTLQGDTAGISTSPYNISIKSSNKVLSTSIVFTENF